MKRLILEIGSGADLYGQDYTKAAIRAFHNAIRHSSITLFSALGVSHNDMDVIVTIGVQDPARVDIDALRAEVPRGNPTVNVVYGGQNITANHNGDTSVIATCAIEAYVPNMADAFTVQ